VTTARLLFGIIVLTCLIMGVSLWFGVPDRKHGEIKRWSWGIGAAALGFFMLALGPLLPTWATHPIGNGAITATALIFAGSVLNFEAPRVGPRWWLWPSFAVTVGVLAALTLGSRQLRLVCEAIWFSSLLSYCAYRVCQAAKFSSLRAYQIIIFGAVGGALAMLGRIGVNAWFYDTPYGNDWHVICTFIAAYIVGTTWTIGYIMLQRDRAQALVRTMAMTDSLTGVYNRRMFFEVAQAELLRAQRESAKMTLFMIDIDHFKRVNDTHGHPVGDKVLQHVADVITECLRVQDILVRYGGEEFCALIVSVSESQALALAQRIRNEVANQPVTVKDLTIPITVSVGVASAWPKELASLHPLIAQADEAVYRAKNSGRNAVVVYTHAVAQ
jgi:diguanylate cyclase (GGDEF)-like protein